MENIINRIIEIDHNASERLEAAENSKKNIIKDADTQKQQIRKRALSDADKRLEEEDAVEKAEAAKKIELIAAAEQTVMNKLQASYDENHLKWETEIIAKIVGE